MRRHDGTLCPSGGVRRPRHLGERQNCINREGEAPAELFSAQQELRPPICQLRLSGSFALPCAAMIGMFSTAARLMKARHKRERVPAELQLHRGLLPDGNPALDVFA